LEKVKREIDTINSNDILEESLQGAAKIYPDAVVPALR
jgi:hypothetical protein